MLYCHKWLHCFGSVHVCLNYSVSVWALIGMLLCVGVCVCVYMYVCVCFNLYFMVNCVLFYLIYPPPPLLV